MTVYTVKASLDGETFTRHIPASSPEAAQFAMMVAFPGYSISEPVVSEDQDSFSDLD